MKSKIIDSQPLTYALVFDKGDEFMAEMQRFADEVHLLASQFTAIGAFSDLLLGYFDRGRKNYKKIPIDEQVEVLTLAGDVALLGGKPKIHAHVVVGKSDGSAYGGHLLEAHVWPTLEVIVTEAPLHLRRRHDETTGLALIDIQA
jgi:predicted DNA-binding protein with PD1-like motif